MKNTIDDLINYQFEMVERLLDDSGEMSNEELEKQIKKAKTISKLSSNIISARTLQLNAMQVKASLQYDYNMQVDTSSILKLTNKK